LTFGGQRLSFIFVKDTYSISDIGRNPAGVIRRAEAKGSVTLSRNGRPVAFVISKGRMEAIIETLEIMANPAAMEAIRAYESGNVRMQDVSVLDYN
jgi:prevent-host-death family protein